MAEEHIKINPVPTKVKYSGNGVVREFPTGFAFFENDNIVVYHNGVVINTGYSITGVGETDGGVVTFDVAPAEGDKIVILRKVDIERVTDFQEGGAFRAKNINDELDRQTAFCQQIQEEIERCVKVEVTDEQTPEELLSEVYGKLDSATAIAGDAINAANQAQTAADNATAAVNQAEQTLTEVTNYVDLAKTDIEGTKNTVISTIDNTVSNAKGEIANTIVSAKADINTAVDEATMNITDIVSDAEGSITNIAVTEANKAIANAAQEATDTATANVNSYVDGTVKPSLQTYVDQAQADANSAATSMEQAALSATAASSYASNASADADNAAESATHAATSAADSEHYSEDSRIWAEGTDSEVQGLGGAHSSKVWADRAEQAAAKAEASTQGGFYNRVHDCILENPRYIIWEQDGNTLTLKAGTKLWYPDGRSVVLENDISGTMTSSRDLVWVDLENNTLLFKDSAIGGPTSSEYSKEHPSDGYATNGTVLYDKTENKFKTSDGSAWVGDWTIPLPVKAIYNSTTRTYSLVINESTFNKGMIVFRPGLDGVEYIFIPEGIKTLACSGLKTDGSYNNVKYTTPSVMTLDEDSSYYQPHYFAIKTDGTVQISDSGFKVTDGNYLQNLSTNEVFSGVRLGNYRDEYQTNIYDTLDLQNSIRVFYWDD